MSFAAGKALRTPVVEFFSGSKIEVVVRAQSTQSRSAIPVIQHQHLCPIFEIAVRSFFNPPLAALNLFFATEWLGMDTTYNESRLINAMTALENLVESNLDADAKQMMPEKKFKKLSRAIGKQIDEYCHQQFGERGDQVAKEIRVKRNELNRRSLVDKLYLLAKRWNVSLDGISEEQIRSAKNARDRIVHRGRFYEDGEQQGEDLWCHVTIAREIVTRLVLTALGHRDAYVSYVGGNHTRTLN
jgi:hypothetical protein